MSGTQLDEFLNLFKRLIKSIKQDVDKAYEC